ncbi:MAG: hypothetical protein ACM3JC_05905 [Rudaea sp.]
MRRSGCCSEEKLTHALHSPYRCNDCDTRFWLLSRSARKSAWVAGALVSVAMLFVVGATLLHGATDAASTTSDAPSPGVSSPAGSALTDGSSASSVPMAAIVSPPR